MKKSKIHKKRVLSVMMALLLIVPNTTYTFANTLNYQTTASTFSTVWEYDNSFNVSRVLTEVNSEQVYKLNVTSVAKNYVFCLSQPSDSNYSFVLYDENLNLIGTQTGGNINKKLSVGCYYIKIFSTDGHFSANPYNIKTDVTDMVTVGGDIVEMKNNKLYLNGSEISDFYWTTSYTYDRRPQYGTDYERWASTLISRSNVTVEKANVGSYVGYEMGKGTISCSNAIKVEITDFDYSILYSHQQIALGGDNSGSEYHYNNYKAGYDDGIDDHWAIIDVATRKVIDSSINQAYNYSHKNAFTQYNINKPVPLTEAEVPIGLEIDIKNEVVTGVSNLMEYSTNGTSWTSISGSVLNITSLIPTATATADTNILIRIKRTDQLLASQPVSFTLDKRRIATPTSTIVKFNGIDEVISVDDTMEYRVGTTGDYISVPKDATSIETLVSDTVAYTYQVRYKSTDENFASLPLSISVPKRATAPTSVYSTSTNTITGMSTAMEYSLDEGKTWIPSTATTLTRAVFGEEATTVLVRVKATATVPYSLTKVVSVPVGSAEAPKGLELDIVNEKVTGVSNLMEYSTNGTSWVAITSNELNITSIIPASTATTDLTLRIRVKATTTDTFSETTEITVPKRITTPTTAVVKFNGIDEVISVDDTMEYRVGTTGDYIAVETGKALIETPVSDTVAYTYQVRFKATDEKCASLPLSVSVPKRATAPTSVYSTSTNTITGMSTAMEYSLDEGKTWITSTATTLTRSVFGEEATTVLVRTKATATVPYSLVKTINVPVGSAEAPKGLELDIANEKVTGVSNLMEYSTNGTSWTAITSNELNITSIIPASTATTDLTLRVRVKATTTDTFSETTEIIVPKRIATPTSTIVKFNGIDEVISVDDTMEYRVGTTGDYTSVPKDATSIETPVSDTVAYTYQVRFKATDEKCASLPLSVSVPKRATAPTSIYSTSTNTITGMSTAMEYSLDEGKTWIPSTTTTLTRSVFGEEASTVLVRIKATATVPYSLVKTINVPVGSAEAPKGLELDIVNEKVTGVSNLMEYSTNGTSWVAITSNELNITSIIPASTATTDLTLRIRVKATTTDTFSETTEITVPKRITTPTTAVVKFNGIDEVISVDDTMEYRVGTTGDYTSVSKDATSIETPVSDTVAYTYQVRFKATDEKCASLPLSVSVPKRATAPTSVYSTATNTITGMSTAMEYSLDEGKIWIPSTATTLTRSVFGEEATTVLVRVKATATVPYSLVKTINVPVGSAEAPKGLELDIASEKVTGVSNLMEYSTNGTSWTAITSNELNITSIVPASTATADLTLRVRVKATTTDTFSETAEVTVPRRLATPTTAVVKFNGIDEVISINDTMEYRVGTIGDYIAVETGKAFIETPVSDTVAYTYQVRVKATDDKCASLPLSISVPKRATAPTSAYSTSTNTITGMSTAMEYSLDEGKTWISSTATTLTRSVFGEEATTVLVRIKATATVPYSLTKIVSVPVGSAEAPKGLELDIANEKVTGVSSLMQYSTNGTTWYNITGEELNVTSLIPASTASTDLSLQIRIKATSIETFSETTVINVPRRSTTPTTAVVKFNGIDEVISVNDTMEYRIGTTGDFTSIDKNTLSIETPVSDTVAYTYQVRVKATDEKCASLPLSVSVPKRATAPSSVYNSTSDIITGMSTSMEYSLDSGDSWISSTATTLTRSLIGEDAITILVRYKATATAPYSLTKIIAVPVKTKSLMEILPSVQNLSEDSSVPTNHDSLEGESDFGNDIIEENLEKNNNEINIEDDEILQEPSNTNLDTTDISNNAEEQING